MDIETKTIARTALKHVHDERESGIRGHDTLAAIATNYQDHPSEFVNMMKCAVVAEQLSQQTADIGQKIMKLLQQAYITPPTQTIVEELKFLAQEATTESVETKKAVLLALKSAVFAVDDVEFPGKRLGSQLSATFRMDEWNSGSSFSQRISALFVDAYGNNSHEIIIRSTGPLNGHIGPRPALTFLKTIMGSVSSAPGSSSSRPPPEMPVLQLFVGPPEEAESIESSRTASPEPILPSHQNGVSGGTVAEASKGSKVKLLVRMFNVAKEVFQTKKSKDTKKVEVPNVATMLSSNVTEEREIVSRAEKFEAPEVARSGNQVESLNVVDQRTDDRRETGLADERLRAQHANLDAELSLLNTVVHEMEDILVPKVPPKNISLTSPRSNDEGYLSTSSTPPKTTTPERELPKREAIQAMGVDGIPDAEINLDALEEIVKQLMVTMELAKPSSDAKIDILANPGRRFPVPPNTKDKKSTEPTSLSSDADALETPILRQKKAQKQESKDKRPQLTRAPELEETLLEIPVVSLRSPGQRQAARGHLSRRHAMWFADGTGMESEIGVGETNRAGQSDEEKVSIQGGDSLQE